MLGPVMRRRLLAAGAEFRAWIAEMLRELGMKRPVPWSSRRRSTTGWRAETNSRMPESSTMGRTQAREVGEVGEEIDLGDVAGGFAYASGVVEELAAEFGEDAALDFSAAFLRGENFYFELFEFGGGEALGVDEGLLSLVIGGNGFCVGLGDFEVVAEDGVEADFEGGDAGAFALAGFYVGH
jgi:hypothetical protein